MFNEFVKLGLKVNATYDIGRHDSKIIDEPNDCIVLRAINDEGTKLGKTLILATVNTIVNGGVDIEVFYPEKFNYFSMSCFPTPVFSFDGLTLNLYNFKEFHILDDRIHCWHESHFRPTLVVFHWALIPEFEIIIHPEFLCRDVLISMTSKVSRYVNKILVSDGSVSIDVPYNKEEEIKEFKLTGNRIHGQECEIPVTLTLMTDTRKTLRQLS